METLLYGVEALTEIIEESCKSFAKGVETGGILIGPKDSSGIITDSVSSSAHAERHPYAYSFNEADTRALNLSLRSYQSRGFDFKGVWHLHPRHFTQLSAGDLETCAGILKDEKHYKINNRLVMNIVTLTENMNGLPVFAYVVSLENDEVAVKDVRIKVMPRTLLEDVSENLLQKRIKHSKRCVGKVEEVGKVGTAWVDQRGTIHDQLTGKKSWLAKAQHIFKRNKPARLEPKRFC